MATKGKRKLVDINDDALRVYAALEKYLDAHSIPYTFHMYGGRAAPLFRRYYVNSVNLCCARSVLPALADLAARPEGAYTPGESESDLERDRR